jgi:hypothetical protein
MEMVAGAGALKTAASVASLLSEFGQKSPKANPSPIAKIPIVIL